MEDYRKEEELYKIEEFRRARLDELNSPRGSGSREELEKMYGKVWSSDDLQKEFEVQAFMAPLVIVKSKADGFLGSFEFQHQPRWYFNYQKDEV